MCIVFWELMIANSSNNGSILGPSGEEQEPLQFLGESQIQTV